MEVCENSSIHQGTAHSVKFCFMGKMYKKGFKFHNNRIRLDGGDSARIVPNPLSTKLYLSDLTFRNLASHI